MKRTYLYLARRYHPDVNPSADARETSLRINQAYADIMSHRHLTELMLKCPAVKAKQEYAEGLQVFQRAKVMAGIDPMPAGGRATGELGKQLQTLGMYLFFVCPGCQWQEKCNHATRLSRRFTVSSCRRLWIDLGEEKRKRNDGDRSRVLTALPSCEIIRSKKVDILFLTGGVQMVEKKADVVLRPKRQVTLPREICDRLGIGPGDVLELTVEDSMIIARPRKTAALEALKEIQQAFQRSGITEDGLQEAGRRIRQEIARERYGVRG